MNNSSYSGIDQEPNGRPVGPGGTPSSATSFDQPPRSPEPTVSSPTPADRTPFRRLNRGVQEDESRTRTGDFDLEPNGSTPRDWSRADELDQARMDDEGGAQTHRRSERTERNGARTMAPDAKLPHVAETRRSFWSRIWR